MIRLDNHYSQFYHPFCEQAQLLTASTGETILICFRSTYCGYESPKAMFPLLPESVLLERGQLSEGTQKQKI
jgi:hypothetical protein